MANGEGQFFIGICESHYAGCNHDLGSVDECVTNVFVLQSISKIANLIELDSAIVPSSFSRPLKPHFRFFIPNRIVFLYGVANRVIAFGNILFVDSSNDIALH